MTPWYHILSERERRKDEVVQAKKECLMRQVEGDKSRGKSYQRWLARLGMQLIAWGRRLEARYDSALSMPNAVQQKSM